MAAGAPGVPARIDDDRGTWIGTGGTADLDTREPMPSEARFRVASVTKSMVAAVVLQLVQESRLSLDEPIGKRLPGQIDGGDRITVRELLNHTGGLATYDHAAEFADPEQYGKRTYTPRQLTDEAERLPRPERGRFSYSNTGYILLGLTTPQAPVFPRYGLGLESVGLTCGETWGATGSIPGYQTFSFADATGERRMTLSVNVQRNDRAVARMLLAAVDALNRYFCGEPYKLPG
ncbi:serine hydrolase domain-containing protein [Nonomuraea angiospora]|uniref:serine hydrolase domain-containing protein n=1 Tax=Nonomuraea angiospora TaxID=46172 RepID=UPI003319A812